LSLTLNAPAPSAPSPTQTRYKIDVRSNAKASFKLRLQCEKLKKTLSANPDAPLNVECLMDDVDCRAHVTRDQLEEWAAPGLERLRKLLQEGLDASGASSGRGGPVGSVLGLGGWVGLEGEVSGVRVCKQIRVEVNARVHSRGSR